MQKLEPDQAFWLTAPHIYTLVTSLDVHGKPNVMGVSWVTRTPFSPPLMLVSIGHTRYSHTGIAEHQEFVIHYPSREQAQAAWLCGTLSGRDGNKIEKVGLELIDSQVVKVPTIKHVTVAFECKLISQLETGDHTVFVGEVVATSGNPNKAEHLYDTADKGLFALDQNGKAKFCD
jgi:flavin reductase (DIM6/NTAB) family NADH-FMN oxidoreductase RutF